MKIPVFEDDIPILEGFGEMHEIELTDPRAVQMARENVAWQADNTYFDASLDVIINGESFFKNQTTDACGLWRGLLNAMIEQGKHRVYFLDSPVDLTVHHQEHYQFEYVHTDYECDDNNFVTSITKKTIISDPLQKEAVEFAISDGFLQYAYFILENDISIAESYKEELKQNIQQLEKREV